MHKKIMIMIIAMTFIAINADTAGRMEHKEYNIPGGDIDLLFVNIDLGAGDFIIMAKDMEEVFIGQADFNPNSTQTIIDMEQDDKTGYLEIESNNLRDHDIDTDDLFMEGALSTRYISDITLDMGACKADIELGGIPLRELNIDIGAAKGILNFSSANPEKLKELAVDAGAAKFSIEKLGNANFEIFNFDGGVGSFELDFSGEWKSKSIAHIEIGLGSATIYIPEELPLRVDAESSFLSSVDFKNFESDVNEDDLYESPGFRDSDYGLTLEIEVGLGSIDIVRR